MKYALLIYGEGNREVAGEMDPTIAAVLDQPAVADWARLENLDSVTTARHRDGRLLLTDGPFIDSKEYLGGLVVVEADDLDAALKVADELIETRPTVVIEVRPILETRGP